MNDELIATSRSTEDPIKPPWESTGHAVDHVAAEVVGSKVSTPESATELSKHGNGIVSGDINGNLDEDPKSGSEAETVVLFGKDEASSPVNGQTIKHESKSEPATPIQDEDKHGLLVEADITRDQTNEAKSLKRKRSTPEPVAGTTADAGNSSNLSSTVSSPTHEARSSSRAISESLLSQSTPPYENARKYGPSRKRKLQHDQAEENGRERRGKRENSLEVIKRQGRRDSGKSRLRDSSHDRSRSPPTRVRERAQSIQSADASIVIKRKKPPPLLVGHLRKGSEDPHADSDDSSSLHGPAQLQRLVSADNTAMSPAKLPHKKHRDKNGRTWLARACAAAEVENAVARLKERPEDLDIADNAGNTPLQIASLEGNADIVQVLLDAGCDTSCKNIDFDTPLIDAVENGHLEVVRMLLKAGLDPRQSNAQGEEPLDLLDPENEENDAMRALLLEAKGKDTRRRFSEDQHGQYSVGNRDSLSAPSPRDSPSLPSARSPPLHGPAPRRRTARSEATRNDLLWISPTSENLRDRAGKGDLEGVDHILNMRPTADTEAVLAAARGGHEVVLQLLIAIGRPEQDPEPLQSSSYKAGHNTPMLAAIGRGNVLVIQLLLDQPGFDPSRRLYKGLTYPEIAKERQGSNWQEEFDILKKAFSAYINRNSKTVSKGLSTKVKAVGPDQRDIKRSKRAASQCSAPVSTKGQSPERPSVEDSRLRKKLPPTEAKRNLPPQEPSEPSSSKHLRVPDTESCESLNAISDREATLLGPPKSKFKAKRSFSDAGTALPKEMDSKPRRRLVSGKTIKSDQEKRRRASMISEASSSSSNRGPIHVSQGDDIQSSKIKEENPKSSTKDRPKDRSRDAIKKRPRKSISPRGDTLNAKRKTSDSVKKTKRRRVDSEGNAIARTSGDLILQSGPAQVANMIVSPPMLVTPPNIGSAPVAFMGNPSPIDKSSFGAQMEIHTDSPVDGTDQALQQSNYLQELQAQTQAEEEMLRQQRLEEKQKSTEQIEAQAQVESEERRQREQEVLAREAKEKLEREEAERQASIVRQQEEFRLEEQRRVEEAERKIRLEREEEEVRIEKKRRDEEIARRRAEHERLRKENEDRKRAEQEERERLARVRRQEEEERRRRASLPNGLRKAAELSSDDARDPREIIRWLPLFTATGRQLFPDCEEQVEDERWISNIQAAPILAITDLDLSQCKFRNKIIVSSPHICS